MAVTPCCSCRRPIFRCYNRSSACRTCVLSFQPWPQAVHMEKMPTSKLFGCSHLLTTYNAGCIASAYKKHKKFEQVSLTAFKKKKNPLEKIYLHIKLIRSCVRETIVHVWSDLSVTHIISHTDCKVTKCLIQLTDQVNRHTIIPRGYTWLGNNYSWLLKKARIQKGKTCFFYMKWKWQEICNWFEESDEKDNRVNPYPCFRPKIHTYNLLKLSNKTHNPNNFQV